MKRFKINLTTGSVVLLPLPNVTPNLKAGEIIKNASTADLEVLSQSGLKRWVSDNAEEPEGAGHLVIVPEPVIVPEEVPLWAFRSVVVNAGLMPVVLAAINGIEDEDEKATTLNFWEYGNYVSRNSPTLLALAPSTGLTSEQIDQAFITASTLRL